MPNPPCVHWTSFIVAASESKCTSSSSGLATPASTNLDLNSSSYTFFMICQNGSCHLKTVFFVTTYGVIFASRHRPKKKRARSLTLSYGLWYVTTAASESVISLESTSTVFPASGPSLGVNVVVSFPLPTFLYPAAYSPPTACRSKNTGFSYPNSTPSM